ncbi:MAG: phage protein Gp27 family protein [Phycisphaerae bacterium]|jgi:hypothetical protein
MKVRRTHSSIDKLPQSLQRALEAMLVDNVYPDDFAGKKTGKPTYKHLEAYCKQRGFVVSKSAMGRFGVRMRILAKMKEAGLIVRSVMEGLTEENTSQTQKAVAELLTARAIEIAASDKTMTSKQIKEVAGGIRDCANISIKADQYRQGQLQNKAKQTADATGVKLKAAGVDRAKVQEIIDDILGITKS